MNVRFSSVALAAIAVLVAVPASAQSVLLRMNPDVGLESRYVMGMETHVQSALMPSDGPFMIGRVYSTQVVLGTDGDVVEYSMTTDSAHIETPAMPQLAGQIPDQTGETVTMKMDTRGRFVSMDNMPPEAQQMATQLGGMRWELPEGEVSAGDTWSADVDMDVPGVPGATGGISMSIDYTLVEVASAGGSQYATIEFSGPISMSGEGQGVGMDAGGTMNGTMVMDVTRGRLASSEVAMALEMNAAGMQMTINQTMTTTLVN